VAGRFDYLKNKAQQEPESEKASAAPAQANARARSRPAAAKSQSADASSEQYGRRADPAYAQINANIPADLRRELRMRLASEEREQQEVLEALIRGYLDGRFKV